MTGAEAAPWLVTYKDFLAHKGQDRLRHGSFRMKLHTPTMPNVQQPHEQDELYLIVSGQGRFTKAGQTCSFGPGDAIFVEAGAEHCFEEISADTLLWILFWGPPGGEREAN